MDNDKRGRSPEVIAREAGEKVTGGKVNYADPKKVGELRAALLTDSERYHDQIVELDARARHGW